MRMRVIAAGWMIRTPYSRGCVRSRGVKILDLAARLQITQILSAVASASISTRPARVLR